MSLSDYAGGGYVPIGEHPLQIIDHKPIRYNSGSAGVEFMCEDDRGRQAKASFCLQAKILWRLAEFAKVAGMSKDIMDKVDPDKGTGFHLFHGLRFIGILTPKVVGDKTYAELTDWLAIGTDTSKAREAVNRLHEHQRQQAAPPPVDDVPPIANKDLPF